MGQQSKNLQKSSQVSLDQNDSISIYQGALTAGRTVHNISLIKKAFPSLPKEFYDVLTDRICAHDFSDNRFTDAILHVIDTCHYPTPTIADFISYDKRIPAPIKKRELDPSSDLIPNPDWEEPKRYSNADRQ